MMSANRMMNQFPTLLWALTVFVSTHLASRYSAVKIQIEFRASIVHRINRPRKATIVQLSNYWIAVNLAGHCKAALASAAWSQSWKRGHTAPYVGMFGKPLAGVLSRVTYTAVL
ncbi:hypothetical protein GGS26DRAFT_303807 [Hypomontagnella submonticulosa]|nr:hypothetical protein GGS26DRAFT_303807 [Hypomontagnella submonticulosa]